MNKLGFAIKSASGGAGNLFECNKDAWTSKVVDIREYQKLFNGLSGYGKFITFLSFDENGSFLVQLRTIAGRENDFLSGWIYIPNEIEITGEDIEEAYNHVRQILCLSSIPSEKQDEINAYFAKEYPTKAAFSKNDPSFGEKFGYRKLNVPYTMSELFSSDIFQEYYNGYKAIFLLEKDSVTISNEYVARFKDFTNYELEKYCILMPPTKETSRPFGLDAQIVDEKGHLFDYPMRIKHGGHVQLYARRKGLEDIRIPQIEISKGITVFPLYHAIDWKKRIDASMFRVVNHDGEVIRNATITVCETNITNANAELSEADAKKASVKISANGYEDYSKTISVLNAPIEIQLHRKEKCREYTILMSNDKEAKMTLSSKYISDEIPLVGYTYDVRNRDILVPSPWYIWKQRLIGICICIIGLFVIAGYYAFDSWLDNHKFILGIPPWQEINKSVESAEGKDDTENQEQEGQTAVAPPYLDNRTTWNKDSLESHEETKGLFDALNEFDFYKVKEYEGKLGNSKNFMKIIDKIKEIEGKGFNPMEGKETNGGKYNPENDKRIDIYNYIKWISSSHVQTYTKSESEKPTGNPIKSDKIKKGATKSEQSTVKKKDVKPKRGGED